MADRNRFADVQARIDAIADLLAEKAPLMSKRTAQKLALEIVAVDPAPQDGVDPNYSAALDEIFDLRIAAVYEAGVIEAHLGLASFPKSRRGIAEKQVERLRAAARGETRHTYGDLSTQQMKHALREAGANQLLTRAQWEGNRARPKP